MLPVLQPSVAGRAGSKEQEGEGEFLHRTADLLYLPLSDNCDTAVSLGISVFLQ